ncbi:hypothetical protein [Azospirillum sp.]|uniref:hypothetical protein n=1 Tax=Azospirillum sp. TaxID=34012 RepID=UPI003D75AFE7
MRTRRFPSRHEAERYLAEQGFEFLGAPSRWRKTLDGHACYADVVVQNGAAVVVFIESNDGLPP